MSEWQPIETAPRDGTRVLLSNGEEIDVGSFYSDVHFTFVPYDRDGRDLYRRVPSSVDEGWTTGLCGVSHWMPLPAPPVTP